MRVTRGLLASLGASGSISAAGAIALLAFSSFVGLRGWPGAAPVRVAPRTLVVAEDAAPRHQRAGQPSSAPVRRVLAATEPAARRDVARGRVGTPAHVTTPASASRPAAAAPAAIAPSPAAKPSSSPASDPVAQTVRETGDTAATTVTPASPTVGQAVTQATDTAAGIVGGVLKP